MRYALKSVVLVALALAAFACSRPAAAQASPSITFTLETTTGADKRSVIPKLTWSTTPAAPSCTASGASNWTGAKASSGTLTLPAVSASVTYTLVCDWPGVTKAALTWTAPTQNTDGSALTNLAGFRPLWGPSCADLPNSVYINDPAARSWQSPDLAPGTWSFAVIAFNTLGLESEPSECKSKTMTAAQSQTRGLELAIKIPKPPVLQ